MALTTIYDPVTKPGTSVKSDVFTVNTSGGAAIRIKGTARGNFSAVLEFSDGGVVTARGLSLELTCANNVATLIQAGDYCFNVSNPDGDQVQIEVRS